MTYRSVTSRMRMSSGSSRREGPSVAEHYVTSLPPTSPLLMSAIHSWRHVRSVQIVPIKSHLHESLSGSKHALFAVWYNCRIVLLLCYVTFAMFLTVRFLAPSIRSPTGFLKSSEEWRHLSGTTLLLAMDVTTQLLIEECAIDLGSCLGWENCSSLVREQ